MEIPHRLKSLYSHWDKHASQDLQFRGFTGDIHLLKEIEEFASERMKIWKIKEIDLSEPPFTEDEVLSSYRFCNVYRELDRQTVDIHTSLARLKPDFESWLLNLAFHRFLVNPVTVNKVGNLTFDEMHNRDVYKRLINLPSPKYGTAYLFPISVIQKSDWPTREHFFTEYLPLKIPDIARIIQSFNNVSVNDALAQILPVFGFNFRFHWTEILIDITYQYSEYINLYEDFHIGPGAVPTLKMLNGTSVEDLVSTKLMSFPYLTYEGNPLYLSAENWEGIFCEFRKYTNLKKGKGRKRKFR